MHVFIPPLEQALARRGEDYKRQDRPALRVRHSPPPTEPPHGPLEVVAGLLLARAIPFDRPGQASIRARWGLGSPATTEPSRDRRRINMRRVRESAAATPVPRQLLDALALLATPACRNHTPEKLARALNDAGLTADAGGPLLVHGLAVAYRLHPQQQPRA